MSTSWWGVDSSLGDDTEVGTEDLYISELNGWSTGSQCPDRSILYKRDNCFSWWILKKRSGALGELREISFLFFSFFLLKKVINEYNRQFKEENKIWKLESCTFRIGLGIYRMVLAQNSVYRSGQTDGVDNVSLRETPAKIFC